MEQQIQGGILDTLKSLFNRMFKDIMSGFDQGGYSKDKESELDLSKDANMPKDSKVKSAIKDVDPKERKGMGMSQTYKNKEFKDSTLYEVKYYDLSKTKGYEGQMYAEICNGKTGEVLVQVLDNEDGFKKRIKKEIQKLMEAERAAQEAQKAAEEASEDVSSSRKMKLNLRKITASNYIDYELADVESNYPLTLVKNDLATVLDIDELYDQLQEGDNNLLVEVDDDEFNITDMSSEWEESFDHILQSFFETTDVLYKYAYQGHYMNNDVNYFEQFEVILKDIMDLTADNLSKESLPVKFSTEFEIDKPNMDELRQKLTEYVGVYNDVVCDMLSFDMQESYDMYVRQIVFLLNNM